MVVDLSTVEAGQGLGGGRFVWEEIDCRRDYRIKLYIFKHFVIVTSISEVGLQHGRDDVNDLSSAETWFELEKVHSIVVARDA